LVWRENFDPDRCAFETGLDPLEVLVMEDLTQDLQSKLLRSRAGRAVAQAVVVTATCALAVSPGFHAQIADNTFFSLTLAGCTIVFLSVRPLRDVPQVVFVWLPLVGLELAVLRVPLRILPALALLGLSSLFVLTVRRIWSSGTDRRLLHDALVPPLLFLLLGYFGSGPLELVSRLHPKTLDLFLYSFDQSLGVQLSFKVGQIVVTWHPLTRAALGLYYALPLVIIFTYARLLVRDRNLAMMAFLAFVIAGPVGVVFYNMVPACGPGYLMGTGFPFEMLPASHLSQFPLEALPVAGARNAFPSLHLGWALLALWYSECLSRRTRVAMAIFAVGTVFATLGLGEHYFVDLVAAFPFALILYAASALNVPITNRCRIAALVAGVAMLMSWVVLLRWGRALLWLNSFWVNSFVSWALVAGSISTSLFLRARLRPLLFAPVDQARGGRES
jgi:PAP2 superfamily